MNVANPNLENVQLTGPYNSLRDFIVALEARGRLLRIKEMDQDQYEATGFAYRLVDKFGIDAAPAFLIERVKVDGEWLEGPVVANIFGSLDTEAMAFGVKNVTDDHREMYRATIDKLVHLADENGQWKRIKPVIIDGLNIPCKEVIKTGDDIDIRQYPWLKCNPADGGRYINSGAVIFEDPELGRNVGTYRCQVKGKTRITVNPEVGQHGWSFLMAAKKRGERSVKAAIVVGCDPITWTMSCSKVTPLGEDEYELSGGLKGRPEELVKCETSDILVPVNAEMIIEGEIPLHETEVDGPHAEMYGYLGQKRETNFFVNIQTITHREKPWIFNNHTGVMRGFCTAPMDAYGYLAGRRSVHNLVAVHHFDGAPGLYVASINKRFAGDGIAAGQQLAASNPVCKIMIVVDNDVDVLNKDQVIHAMATRWQPHPATLVVPQARGTFLEPSTRLPRVTSNVIIDATKQLPEEGGPQKYPEVSRVLLEEAAPEVFNMVDSKWSEYLGNHKH